MSERKLNAFSLDRRAFLGAAAAAGAASASGAAVAAGPDPASSVHVEPDLADATSNAPSYWAHPRNAAKRRPVELDDPLQIALSGQK